MKYKIVSIRIEEELWKRFSKKCIEENRLKRDVISELIRKWVRGEVDA